VSTLQGGITIVGLTLVLLILAIWLTGKWKWFSEARAMTAPMFAMTMIPAFYTVFGSSYQIDLMATYGVQQWWLYAVSWYPAYVLVLILMSQIRSTSNLTLPDRFVRFGNFAEFLSSVISFLYVMPLDVLLMLGVLGSLITGLSVELFILVFGVFLILFTAKKGWSGYSLAGILYFVMMALGVGVSSIALVSAAGGWNAITANLKSNGMGSLLTPWFTDFGGFIKLLTVPANLIWFLMGFVFLIDPMVWQRISLTDSSSSARKGMLFAILFWMVFDISTVFSGLAIASIGGSSYLGTAFEVLPTVWVGLVASGNLMAALAGGSAYLHAGGMIFSRNIGKALGIIPDEVLASDELAKKWYERGVYIVGGIGLVLTLIVQFAFPKTTLTTSLFWLIVSGLLFGALGFPVIAFGLILRNRIPSKAKDVVNLSMVSGLIVTVAMMFYGFIYPNATSMLTLGITPSTAFGTPYIDASRVIGFFASIMGAGVGSIVYLIKGRK
jgi:Na+/proline symporter